LLLRTAAVSGLDAALSARLRTRPLRRARHDSGKVVLDLAVAIALGGDCRADLAVVRAQPQLFRPVTSGPTVSRLISSLTGDAATVGVPGEGRIHGFAAVALLGRGSGARPVAHRSRVHRLLLPQRRCVAAA
jgi:hypothetical protein